MALPNAPLLDDRNKARITCAKQDRDRHMAWINDSLRLALPTYRRIGETMPVPGTAQMRVTETDDLFDPTLQNALEDFASDKMGTFTPRFEHWVTLEPAEDLTEGQMRAIGGQLRQIEDSVFGEIERSNYYQAALECFAFWGVAAMGMAMSDMGPLNPIHCQPIEIPDLLMERGPDGTVTGRWREMYLDERQMAMLWPTVFAIPPRTAQPTRHYVIEGCDRDFSRPGEERWNYRIIADWKQHYARSYVGTGSCPVITARFRHQADSAWGPGPVQKALPLARTLDELAYLNLKGIGRSIDPPNSYEEDGVQNYEGGVDDGAFYPRAAGSKTPEPLLPDIRFDASYFEKEKLEEGIKRALYQDKPEQPGKTPPTATQWIDEKEFSTRRMELPRDRCVREWVMPVIDRVMWIKSQRGELPSIKLGDRMIKVRPVSPLSKAKDLQDVQITGQLLGMAQQIGTIAQSVPMLDPRGTLRNIQRTLGERNIVFLTDEQLAQAAQLASQQATVSDAGPAGALT